MEKLLNLLNEYGKEHFEKCTNSENDLRIRKEICTEAYDEEVIISKRFGFIKRLVENDKIDQNTKFLISANVENQKTWMWYVHTFDQYESLLMLLSIQENSIEFLISILK